MGYKGRATPSRAFPELCKSTRRLAARSSAPAGGGTRRLAARSFAPVCWWRSHAVCCQLCPIRPTHGRFLCHMSAAPSYSRYQPLRDHQSTRISSPNLRIRMPVKPHCKRACQGVRTALVVREPDARFFNVTCMTVPRLNFRTWHASSAPAIVIHTPLPVLCPQNISGRFGNDIAAS
jgi:hypothetical protein